MDIRMPVMTGLEATRATALALLRLLLGNELFQQAQHFPHINGLGYMGIHPCVQALVSVPRSFSCSPALRAGEHR